jgi:hypothetical protein
MFCPSRAIGFPDMGILCKLLSLNALGPGPANGKASRPTPNV